MSARIATIAGADLDAQQMLLLASGFGTALGLMLTGQSAALVFTTAQTLALAAAFVRSVSGRRGWRSAEFLVALSWLLLFTVPCWLYALSPDLLDQGTPARAALLVNIALYAYLAGILIRPVQWRPEGGPIAVAAMQPRSRVLTAWWLLGCGALCALLLRQGNPLDYLSRLDRSAAMNFGAFYLVAIALLMRYAALAWAAGRWSRGERLEPLAIALGVVGTVLVGLTGARLFVAIAFVDFVLLYVLLRRHVSLRRIAPYAVGVGIALVFVAGAIKRYQGYNAAHPDAPVGFAEYATERAPSELATAYANNYVDTVRLLAIADVLVPRSADWEGARPLLEMAVKPLPHAVRPDLDRQPVLQQAFSPNTEYSFAMPLVATSFLAGGVIAIVLAMVAMGALVAALDRTLSSNGLTARSAVVLVVAIGSVPSVFRAGVPAGATLLLVDVIGMWVVARTGLRTPPCQSARRSDEPTAPPGAPMSVP